MKERIIPSLSLFHACRKTPHTPFCKKRICSNTNYEQKKAKQWNILKVFVIFSINEYLQLLATVWDAKP